MIHWSLGEGKALREAAPKEIQQEVESYTCISFYCISLWLCWTVGRGYGLCSTCSVLWMWQKIQFLPQTMKFLLITLPLKLQALCDLALSRSQPSLLWFSYISLWIRTFDKQLIIGNRLLQPGCLGTPNTPLNWWVIHKSLLIPLPTFVFNIQHKLNISKIKEKPIFVVLLWWCVCVCVCVYVSVFPWIYLLSLMLIMTHIHTHTPPISCPTGKQRSSVSICVFTCVHVYILCASLNYNLVSSHTWLPV